MDNVENGFQPKACKSGTDYELWVLNLLNIAGFNAKRTGKEDNGVDIMAEINICDTIYKFNIQCKFYNKPIGKAPIQEVYTGSMYYNNNGNPVVITNNRMTIDALNYAKSMGVEVISQFEFDELSMIVRNKLTINDVKSHLGLLGIIIGQHFKNADYISNSVKSYKSDTDKIIDRADELKDEISSIFDEAESLVRESSEMQMRAIHKYNQALNLQKEALIKHLNYPDSDVAKYVLGGSSMADIFEQLLKSIDSLSPDQFEKLYAVMEKQMKKKGSMKYAVLTLCHAQIVVV